MLSWTNFSLKNAIAVFILCGLVVGGGWYSAARIGMETFPDVTLPGVAIQVIYPGASTEEVEQEVTNPLEEQLLALKGYERITSTSRENVAIVFMLYSFGEDMDLVVDEIEKAIAEAKLPDKVETDVIRQNPNDFPVYEVGITSTKHNETSLYALMDTTVLPSVQKVDGVAKATLQGGSETEVVIAVDETKAVARGLTLQAIMTAIREQEYALPLGTVSTVDNEVPVRLVGGFGSLEGLRTSSLFVAGQTIRLADIATIEVVATQETIVRTNEKPSLMLSVTKEQDSNTVEVGDAVKEVLASYEKTEQLQFSVLQDNAREVKKSVQTLLQEGGYGVLFTVIVIFLFLRNLRATMIAILSLPLSIFATISVLDLTGNTLNIMTLGGLAVSVGRIVDDSIVVIENIFRWRQQQQHAGKSSRLLAYLATKEVIAPVASSTIATVVVFVPLAFVGGIIGEFFAPFALTVAVSIITSLLVAMTLIPVLGSQLLNKVNHAEKEGFLVRGYRPMLRWALRYRFVVYGSAVVLLGGAIALIPVLGVTFLPTGGKVLLRVNAELPKAASAENTIATADRLETYFSNHPEVRNAFVFITPERRQVNMALELESTVDAVAYIQRVEPAVTRMAKETFGDTTVSVQEERQNAPPTAENIEINLFSNDQQKLKEAAKQVQAVLEANEQLKDVRNSTADGIPKWEVALRPEAKTSGVIPYAILGAVQERLRPQEIGVYTWEDESWKVMIQFAQSVVSEQQLKKIPIMTAQGVRALEDVATITVGSAPISIQHEEGRTNAVVSGNITGGDTVGVSEAVEQKVKALSFAQGVEVKVGGGFEEIFEGFSALGVAMAIAVGLVFIVLTVTFGGIVTPLVILATLAFVPIGSFTGLLMAGQMLSMSAMIGLLMLIGIVVTNAVVLLQRIEENRQQGVALEEAIVEASVTRLRPILMTALATIFALLPLALSQASAGLLSKSLAVTVIGGLATSTLLTLLFVPALYLTVGRYRKFQETLET